MYFVRRCVLMVPTLLIVTLLTFGMMRLLPGDALTAHASEGATLNEQAVARLREELGLDRPFLVQYGSWLAAVAHGDLGLSLASGKPIADEVAIRLPVTIELGVVSLLVCAIVAFAVGTLAAIRRNTPLDVFLRVLAIGFISVPNFWVGTLVILLPAIWWGYLPPLTYVPFFQDPLLNLKQFFPPAIVLGLAATGGTMRLTRSSLLDVLSEDYIRTAFAKGLRQRAVVLGHAVKNSLIPVVTVFGARFSLIVGGSLIIENIFALPGMGQLAVNALALRDYTALQAFVLITALAVVVANLAIDLLYLWLDPRIRYT